MVEAFWKLRIHTEKGELSDSHDIVCGIRILRFVFILQFTVRSSEATNFSDSKTHKMVNANRFLISRSYDTEEGEQDNRNPAYIQVIRHVPHCYHRHRSIV